MPKLAVHMLIFLIGVVLAFCVLLYGAPIFALPNQTTNGKTDLAPYDNSKQEVSPQLEAGPEHRKRARLSREIPRERLLQTLTNVLKDGNSDALQSLRVDYLSILPDYESVILPALKRQALECLLDRFSDSDWADWPSSAYANDGAPTLARRYVDDVSLVNPELGKFLETAAQLLYGMQLTIMSGSPYQLEDDLYFVIQNAERLVPKKRPVAIPARLLLEPGILHDQVFLDVIEWERGKLVARYIERYPYEMQSGLKLVQVLKPEYCGKAVFRAVRSLIYNLSFEASARLRLDAAQTISESPVFSEIARSDGHARYALAEFYVVAAVDALEAGQAAQSHTLLDTSIRTMPGLETQKMLVEFLSRPRVESTAAQEDASSKRKGGKVERADSKFELDKYASEEKEPGGINYQQVLMVLILLGSIGFVGGRFLMAYLTKKTIISTPGEKEGTSSVLGPKVSITSPSDIQFDDELELKIANR
jgi:hypothetical protein